VTGKINSVVGLESPRTAVLRMSNVKSHIPRLDIYIISLFNKVIIKDKCKDACHCV